VKRESEARVPKVTPVEKTDKVPAGTYLGYFGKKSEPFTKRNKPNQHNFALVELKNPVHPSEVVEYFSGVLVEKGLNPKETWGTVKELESGVEVSFLWEGATLAETKKFLKQQEQYRLHRAGRTL
jgi:hypothetical protein